jgi:hypothetical protein
MEGMIYAALLQILLSNKKLILDGVHASRHDAKDSSEPIQGT